MKQSFKVYLRILPRHSFMAAISKCVMIIEYILKLLNFISIAKRKMEYMTPSYIIEIVEI